MYAGACFFYFILQKSAFAKVGNSMKNAETQWFKGFKKADDSRLSKLLIA